MLLLGARKGKYANNHIYPIPGSNLPLATLGTFILWFGWFGFNGGSQLFIADKINSEAVATIFLNTNISGAAGATVAFIVYKIIWEKADLTMILNGALAGLVAITADPLSPSIMFSAVIGGIAGALVIISIVTLDKLRIDDPVGAISVHGVCSILGLIFVPLSNKDASLLHQLMGIGTILIWSFIMSFIIWTALKLTLGIRISEEDEYYGMDITDCGLEAYPELSYQKITNY